MRRLVAAASALLVLSSCSSSSASAVARGQEHHLAAAGRDRTYLEHVPATHPAQPSVVLILHGGDSNAQETESGSGWDAEADAQGFIAVYPQGIENGWADGRGQDPPDKEGVDDVAFLAAVIADVEARDAVDPARVFLTGISNGGFMDERFACGRADLVTAIAPDASSLGQSTYAACKPSRPVSVMDVHGTADPLVPYGGGTMHGRGGATQIVSAAEVFMLWASRDGCSGQENSQLPDTAHDGMSVTITRATGCARNTRVEQWTVVGGGHTWPGGKQYLPKAVIGPVSHQFVFQDAAWEFFSEG